MVATNEAASHHPPTRRFLKARCNVKRMATELLMPKYQQSGYYTLIEASSAMFLRKYTLAHTATLLRFLTGSFATSAIFSIMDSKIIDVKIGWQNLSPFPRLEILMKLMLKYIVFIYGLF